MIADEVSFSVLPAKHYRFLIILSPVGSYYAANDGGLSTTRIYVEDEFSGRPWAAPVSPR